MPAIGEEPVILNLLFANRACTIICAGVFLFALFSIQGPPPPSSCQRCCLFVSSCVAPRVHV